MMDLLLSSGLDGYGVDLGGGVSVDVATDGRDMVAESAFYFLNSGFELID